MDSTVRLGNPWDYLLEQVQDGARRRDWASLPQGFEYDAVRSLRDTFRVHLRGKHHIKARVKLAHATTFADLVAVIFAASAASVARKAR